VITANQTGQANSRQSTVVYSAQLSSTTSLATSYTFQFDGTNLTFNPQSLKWSVNLSSASSAFGLPITLTYDLVQLSSSVAVPGQKVVEEDGKPANSTTYFLLIDRNSSTGASSSSDTMMLVAWLQVLDNAQVDGQLVCIHHEVNITAAGGYVLVLAFPAFNSLLYYDPVLELGLLVGNSASAKSETTLIVSVTVRTVSVVILGVVTVAAVGALIVWRQKRNVRNHLARCQKF